MIVEKYKGPLSNYDPKNLQVGDIVTLVFDPTKPASYDVGREINFKILFNNQMIIGVSETSDSNEHYALDKFGSFVTYTQFKEKIVDLSEFWRTYHEFSYLYVTQTILDREQ